MWVNLTLHNNSVCHELDLIQEFSFSYLNYKVHLTRPIKRQKETFVRFETDHQSAIISITLQS